MKIRKVLAAVTGLAQEAIGLLAAVLAVLLFFDFLEVQTVFSLPVELLPFYLLILLLFSLFSIVSGLFLIREGRGRT
jgi:uncharacterized membrane protein YozB (DUF420 family)